MGGGGERLFTNISDLSIDADEEERNMAVFKLEFLFNDNVLLLLLLFVVDAGNVDELLVERKLRRLETLKINNFKIETKINKKSQE